MLGDPRYSIVIVAYHWSGCSSFPWVILTVNGMILVKNRSSRLLLENIYDVRLLNHASKILLKKHGKDDMYTAWCFLRLGYVLTYAGHYNKARKFIEEGYKEYGRGAYPALPSVYSRYCLRAP